MAHKLGFAGNRSGKKSKSMLPPRMRRSGKRSVLQDLAIEPLESRRLLSTTIPVTQAATTLVPSVGGDGVAISVYNAFGGGSPPNPVEINGMHTSNFCPGLGRGKIYDPKIYGFKVSEVSRVGPRMKWLRMKPRDIYEVDEVRNYELSAVDREEEARENEAREREADNDGDTEMNAELSQEAAIANRKKAPMRRRRQVPSQTAPSDQMSVQSLEIG